MFRDVGGSCEALSVTASPCQPSAQVASVACSPLWLQTCHRHICLTRRAPRGRAKSQQSYTLGAPRGRTVAMKGPPLASPFKERWQKSLIFDGEVKIQATQFGSGRKRSLLPALAANVPPARLLNALRSQGESYVRPRDDVGIVPYIHACACAG